MKKLLFVFLILTSGFALSQNKTYKLKGEVTHVEVDKNKISIMGNPIYLDFELSPDYMAINGVSKGEVVSGKEGDDTMMFVSDNTVLAINVDKKIGVLGFEDEKGESVLMYFKLQ